ncbi:MAG: IclR family transcriptional regulator [Deltaproteobacteria bacterium]|nr:IclR family transcriptional regulator [Deltaproteobacteria bacterium]MBW2070076.1 IclR family transcriptional regulator [Deltaproteobacteria bacterium]
MKESERHIAAVVKALTIMECLETHASLTLKEISTLTGLNKSRIIRLCGTLVSKSYLTHDSATGKYSLGGKVLSLAKAYEKHNPLISLARPLLRALACSTGETSALYVLDGWQRRCVAREEGQHPVRYASEIVGQSLALHAGASGKVLLAFGPEEIRQEVLRQDSLERFTPNTITDAKVLGVELQTIRTRGYAFSVGERVSEVAALAVPVFDYGKRLCAALSIAGPIQRFSANQCATSLALLKKAAQQLSGQLGYKP